MFGDTGHAVMMMLFAIALIVAEKKLGGMKLNEAHNFFLNITNFKIVDMLFNGRYVLLMMAMFSVFTGLIYNDVNNLLVATLAIPGFWTWC